jgi:hypothetical protein
MTMTTTKMKARALNVMRVIRPAQNAIDAFQRAQAEIDVFPPEQNATDATRPGQNAVDATEPEPNTSVAECELAPDSDVVVGPLRSNCPPRDPSFRDCAGIAPGQTVWAELAAPTTSIAPVTAVGSSQAPNHTRALRAAKNDTAYPARKLTPVARENSMTGGYPAGSRPPANCDFARSPPANSTAPSASCFADLKSQVGQGV